MYSNADVRRLRNRRRDLSLKPQMPTSPSAVDTPNSSGYSVCERRDE